MIAFTLHQKIGKCITQQWTSDKKLPYKIFNIIRYSYIFDEYVYDEFYDNHQRFIAEKADIESCMSVQDAIIEAWDCLLQEDKIRLMAEILSQQE